jgi:hypothetical protein
MEQVVKLKSLLGYISEENLDFIAKETSVDWNVKKLKGKELFKLCLYGILNNNRASSRVLESYYENTFFKKYASIEDGKNVSHSSIADRISNIQVEYFEELYNHCVEVFSKKIDLNSQEELCVYDSTITSISSSLLSFGMQNGQKNKLGEQGRKSIKFTIGFNGLPFKVKTHHTQEMISEDLALGDILNEHIADAKNIAVFDRGMKDRNKMVLLNSEDKYFVTRINSNSKYKIASNSEIKHILYETEQIKLVHEKDVNLYYGNGRIVRCKFRLIEGILKSTGEKILFLSNLPKENFNSAQIAEIYKNRWKIEQFFRFIKQELNFKHFYSRTWNGIKVMTYMTLIASILLLTYIKLNKLKGYKIPRIKFCNELQNEILYDIITHCGGNPEFLSAYKVVT